MLIPPSLREKVVKSLSWLQKCATMNLVSVVDAAISLDCVGGVYSDFKTPTMYLCLLYRLLELAPSLDLAASMWSQDYHKYLRVLALHYLRLIATRPEIYVAMQSASINAQQTIAEIMHEDYRKLRVREEDGQYKLLHVDEFCEMLLVQKSIYGVILPTLRSAPAPAQAPAAVGHK